MARQGSFFVVGVGHGKARRGKPRLVLARQGAVWGGKVRQGLSFVVMVLSGDARSGNVMLGVAWRGRAR